MQLVAALEERQALEETEDFNHGHVSCSAAASCQGWLWRRGTGKLGTWSRRFVRVADGQLQQMGAGADAVNLVTCRVKMAVDNDRRNCFSVITPNGNDWLLQAMSAADREVWAKAIEVACFPPLWRVPFTHPQRPRLCAC